MSKQPTVVIGARIPVVQWQRLERLARDRGYLRGDDPNISEAAREAIGTGLKVIEGTGESDNDANNED